jgi:hypothetical protein
VTGEVAVVRAPLGGAGGNFGQIVYAPVVLTGSTYNTIPVASSKGDGTFIVTNVTDPDIVSFQTWAGGLNVKVVPGDFNGDGFPDIALTGGYGWSTIPVAFSQNNGFFTVRNLPDSSGFVGLATQAGVQAVAGDFNGDGRDDIALTGASGWTAIPVAYSQGFGTFTFNPGTTVPNFPAWAATAGAKAVPGDFNNDGKGDIALTGVSGWTTIRVATSNGTGGFTVYDRTAVSFPGLASVAGAKVVAGDFNGDGVSDIALTGVSGWTSVPLVLGIANAGIVAGFTFRNQVVQGFPADAAAPGAQVVTGDFNGDGRGDIALTGASGWTTIPVALSSSTSGNFIELTKPVANFPGWATFPAAKAVGAY